MLKRKNYFILALILITFISFLSFNNQKINASYNRYFEPKGLMNPSLPLLNNHNIVGRTTNQVTVNILENGRIIESDQVDLDFLIPVDSYYLAKPYIRTANGEEAVLFSKSNVVTKNTTTVNYSIDSNIKTVVIHAEKLNDRSIEINYVDTDYKDLNIKPLNTSQYRFEDDIEVNNRGSYTIVRYLYYTNHDDGTSSSIDEVNLINYTKSINVEKGNMDDLKVYLSNIKSQLENSTNSDWKINDLIWLGLGQVNPNSTTTQTIIGQGTDPLNRGNGIKYISVDVKFDSKTEELYDYTIKYIDEYGRTLDTDYKKGTPNTNVSHNPKNINGYTPISNEPKTMVLDKDNKTMTFTYKKESNPVKYTIYYKYGNKVLEQESLTGENGTTVRHYPKNIFGYRPVSNDSQTLTLDKNKNNVIEFQYNLDNSKADIKYKVQYKYNNTILDQETYLGQNGDTVTHSPKSIKGYTPQSNKNQSLKLDKDKNNLIIFQYNKLNNEVPYEVQYKNGNKLLDLDQFTGNNGQKVTANPKNIPGYTVINNKPKSIILNKDGKNIIVFDYMEDRNINELLNKDDHLAYIHGYPDKTVKPMGQISRAEVAEVFYRLLKDDYKTKVKTTKNNFPDVNSKDWYNTSVSTLVNANIITGYEDGKFYPNKPITRAELSTIAAKFDKLNHGTTNFKDIKGHWAESYIISASTKGWVNGYKDGTFKPNQLMTRAEFVTLVNNVLNRNTKVENMIVGRIEFKDLKLNTWYYEAMQEAINSHTYEEKRLQDGSEKWIQLINKTLID